MITAVAIKEEPKESNEPEQQQDTSGAKQDSRTEINQNPPVKTEGDANAGGNVVGISKTDDQQPIQPSPIGDDLILSFETRNAIIHHLTEIPSYLFCPPITEEDKGRLIKESNDLILSLASLPLRNEHKSNRTAQTDQEPALLLEITWDFKSKMVSQLASNLSYTVFYGDSASIEAKRRLIEENNKVINDLLNLPIRAKNELTKKRESNQEDNAAEADFLLIPCEPQAEQPTKKIKLEEKVDRMERIIDEVYVNRGEANFLYELKNATSFIEAGERRMSDPTFCCRGIEWALMLDFKTDAEEVKFLSIYLCAQDDKLTSDWRMKGSYEIKILNQLDGESVVRKDTVTFRNAKFSRDWAWGYTQFAKLSEVTDPLKGFLKNDTLVFEVYLKADRMVIASD